MCYNCLISIVTLILKIYMNLSKLYLVLINEEEKEYEDE